MKLTKAQKKAMRELTLCKVIRRKMWRSSKQLGYTSPSVDRITSCGPATGVSPERSVLTAPA